MRRVALWQAYLLAGAALTALYALVAPLKGSGPVFNLLGLSPVIAIVVGVHRHRPAARAPWWLLAGAQALFWAGDLYTYTYPRVFGGDVPFPSPGDAMYLAVYPLQMAGLLLLVRRRNPEGDRAGVIDSLIITVGLSLLSWIGLIAPSLHAHDLTDVQKLVSIAYPLGDILLLAAAIRLTVDKGRRQGSFFLLAGSIVALLVTDFAYGLVTLAGNYHNQVILDVGWLTYYLLWGAAALHPSMRGLDRPAPERAARLSAGRLLLLTAASLVAPVVEIVLSSGPANTDLLVIIAASMVLFGLVVARMADLVRQQERSMARERTLTAAGAALVAATQREEIHRAALDAARALTACDAPVLLCGVDADNVEVVASEPPGARLPAADGPALRLPLAVRGETRGMLIVDAPAPRPVRGSLRALASHVPNCYLRGSLNRPKPALQRGFRCIGAPGFEPGTSPTRTVRATRLRHAPRRLSLAAARVPVAEGRAQGFESLDLLGGDVAAREANRDADLLEVAAAAVAARDVALEALAGPARHCSLEVLRDQLDHLDARQLSGHGPSPSSRCSSAARTFERARCSRTR